MTYLKMKTVFFVFSGLMICGTINALADNSGTRIGISAGWLEKFYFYNENATNNFVHEYYDSIEAAVHVDWNYLRLNIGYAQQVLAYIYDNSVNEQKSDDYDISFLNFSFLGKYPFEFSDGDIQLWPALGLEYDLNLTYKKNGNDITGRYNELNDLYIVTGLGFDYSLSQSVSLTTVLLAGFNLTPEVGDDSTIGSNYSGLNIRLRFGCQFKI